MTDPIRRTATTTSLSSIDTDNSHLQASRTSSDEKLSAQAAYGTDNSAPGRRRWLSRVPSFRLPAPATNGSYKEVKNGQAKAPFPWWRVRRLIGRPLPALVMILILTIIWWTRGAREELKDPEVQQELREMFPPAITKGLRFFPASNNKIHYVGRWTTAPNRLRIDGAFPGVYFDLNVTNTSTVLLSLSNAQVNPEKPVVVGEDLGEEAKLDPHRLPTTGHQYAFSAASRFHVGAPPISLLALVDEEEYVVLPNASSLVPVRSHDLTAAKSHSIRIIAPMTDDDGQNVVQFDGIWLAQGGQLLPVEGTSADGRVGEDDDELDPESDEVGAQHRIGLKRILQYGHGQHHGQPPPPGQPEEVEDLTGDAFNRRRKLVEIVTDNPVHLQRGKKKTRSGGSDGLLSGVMGWEYLLGEMFGVDHVAIGVDGMCLTHDCVGGTGDPSGMGDVFFRSGPVHSIHFGHPWPFQSYVPDVLILNLGQSDYHSFTEHLEEYNKTTGELFHAFEDTYVSLVRAIRNLAYPTHPTVLEMQRLGLEDWSHNTAPASIPIFIMRPFLGEMEHATQNAVHRLRNEGDRGVFWLDTSGWLDPESVGEKDGDFFADAEDKIKRLHLTEHGNQKAAIYLHMHVCRYLAAMDEKCAFLPPEVYQGNVYDPQVATFDRYIEVEKERQMREIFWERGL